MCSRLVRHVQRVWRGDVATVALTLRDHAGRGRLLLLLLLRVLLRVLLLLELLLLLLLLLQHQPLLLRHLWDPGWEAIGRDRGSGGHIGVGHDRVRVESGLS